MTILSFDISGRNLDQCLLFAQIAKWIALPLLLCSCPLSSIQKCSGSFEGIYPFREEGKWWVFIWGFFLFWFTLCLCGWTLPIWPGNIWIIIIQQAEWLAFSGWVTPKTESVVGKESIQKSRTVPESMSLVTITECGLVRKFPGQPRITQASWESFLCRSWVQVKWQW